jgi:hypothetical protein
VGNGTNGLSCGPLDNGLHIGLDVSVYNSSAPSGSTSATTNPPRPEHKIEASTFVTSMQHYGWSNPLNEIDSQLPQFCNGGSCPAAVLTDGESIFIQGYVPAAGERSQLSAPSGEEFVKMSRAAFEKIARQVLNS